MEKGMYNLAVLRHLTLCLVILGVASCPSAGGGSAPAKVIFIDTGGLYSCALISNGRVHCWGDAGAGQLGYGNNSDRNAPGEAIPGLDKVVQISAGSAHTCALISDGSSHCWGEGRSGRLGYGGDTDTNSPGGAIPGLNNAIQISAGGSHVCALVSNGSVHCWGEASNNQLGYGSTSDRDTPGGPIPDLGNVVQISAGSFHNCALVSNGSVHCWGVGVNGRLGYGDAMDRSSPGAPIPGLENVTQVSAGNGHTCALVSNGSVHCWGYGTEGQLGYGATSERMTPGEAIPGLANVTQISTGEEHTCALVAGGSAHCWGEGEEAQLGYGSTSDRTSPGEAIPGLSDIRQISSGFSHTCAFAINGSVYCWGQGTSGQLGNGNTTNQASPGEPISFPF